MSRRRRSHSLRRRYGRARVLSMPSVMSRRHRGYDILVGASAHDPGSFRAKIYDPRGVLLESTAGKASKFEALRQAERVVDAMLGD